MYPGVVTPECVIQALILSATMKESEKWKSESNKLL